MHIKQMVAAVMPSVLPKAVLKDFKPIPLFHAYRLMLQGMKEFRGTGGLPSKVSH